MLAGKTDDGQVEERVDDVHVVKQNMQARQKLAPRAS